METSVALIVSQVNIKAEYFGWNLSLRECLQKKVEDTFLAKLGSQVKRSSTISILLREGSQLNFKAKFIESSQGYRITYSLHVFLV